VLSGSAEAPAAGSRQATAAAMSVSRRRLNMDPFLQKTTVTLSQSKASAIAPNPMAARSTRRA
jgi:hypothetical protein